MAAFAAGRIVIVCDDADRENEGDLIVAADAATPETIAFFVRYTPASSACRCSARAWTSCSCR